MAKRVDRAGDAVKVFTQLAYAYFEHQPMWDYTYTPARIQRISIARLMRETHMSRYRVEMALILLMEHICAGCYKHDNRKWLYGMEGWLWFSSHTEYLNMSDFQRQMTDIASSVHAEFYLTRAEA